MRPRRRQTNDAAAERRRWKQVLPLVLASVCAARAATPTLAQSPPSAVQEQDDVERVTLLFCLPMRQATHEQLESTTEKVREILDARLRRAELEDDADLRVRSGDDEIWIEARALEKSATSVASLVRARGELEFCLAAQPQPEIAAQARQRFQEWMRAAGDRAFAADAAAVAECTADLRCAEGFTLFWAPAVDESSLQPESLVRDTSDDGRSWVLMERARDPDSRFDQRSLHSLRETTDHHGLPALAFELHSAEPFRSFTAEHVGRNLGVLLDGVVYVLPTVHSPIAVQGVISFGSGDAVHERIRHWFVAFGGEPLPGRPEQINIGR